MSLLYDFQSRKRDNSLIQNVILTELIKIMATTITGLENKLL